MFQQLCNTMVVQYDCGDLQLLMWFLVVVKWWFNMVINGDGCDSGGMYIQDFLFWCWSWRRSTYLNWDRQGTSFGQCLSAQDHTFIFGFIQYWIFTNLNWDRQGTSFGQCLSAQNHTFSSWIFTCSWDMFYFLLDPLLVVETWSLHLEQHLPAAAQQQYTHYWQEKSFSIQPDAIEDEISRLMIILLLKHSAQCRLACPCTGNSTWCYGMWAFTHIAADESLSSPATTRSPKLM